jgi:hypothetical protein
MVANGKIKKEAGGIAHNRSIGRMREGYSSYGTSPFRLLAVTCTQAHFVVVDITFDDCTTEQC